MAKKNINLVLLLICCQGGLINLITISSAIAQQAVHINQQNLTVIESSKVVSDIDNVIKLSENIGELGGYKYSLNGDLKLGRTQSATPASHLKVVKNPHTGRIGLTSGVLIVQYSEGEDGLNVAAEYDLLVIKEIPSLNRVVIQLDSASDYNDLNVSMRQDQRVVSTELDVYYGGGKTQ